MFVSSTFVNYDRPIREGWQATDRAIDRQICGVREPICGSCPQKRVKQIGGTAHPRGWRSHLTQSCILTSFLLTVCHTKNRTRLNA